MLAIQDKRTQRFLWSVVSYTFLIIFLIFFLFPIFWMLLSAFKSNAEITRNENPLSIEQPTLESIEYLFEFTEFPTWVGNSLIVSGVTTIVSVITGTLAAYALVRLRFMGSGPIGLSVFATYLLPQTLLFIPIAVIIQEVGLYNNMLALIAVYPTMMVPFCTWLLMGYFRSIPTDMEESARVDGATRWQAFYKVTLPLARSGIISAAIFTFTLSWSEYLYALVLLPTDSNWTIPIGVPNALSSGDQFIWGSIMAAALLGALPVVLIYAFFMRYFVSGMTAGAVKG
jgi:multiple sugar transport system permease protein